MSSRASRSRDLDDRAAIAALIDSFYERVLADATLAPVFTEVAGIDLDEHLPRIKAFWHKMLLGEPGYDRNMVARHAQIHARLPLQRHHFERWLTLFHESVEAGFVGPGAERAKRLATRIAHNLECNLDEYTAAARPGLRHAHKVDEVMAEGEDASNRLAPTDLADRVRAATRRARATGALISLDTQVRVLTDGGLPFLVRVTENVARKQVVATGGNAPAGDPFTPPYEADLYVGEVSATHVALLNKFNVLDDHVLLVTRDWADQTEMLNASDFEALLLGLAGMDGLAFYNGGPEAGASQPHKHLQLVPLPLAPMGPALPFAQLLERTQMNGATGEVPQFPFQHAVAPLRPEWLEHPARHAGAALAVAERLWEALGYDPRVRHQPVPYNLLATRRWLWLVPRRHDRCAGLPVNALAFAGALLAPDETAFARLQELGPMTLLETTGEPRAGDSRDT